MKRIPEPEIMNDPSQVLAYSKADFSDSNTLFVDYILNDIDSRQTLNILDLGCGPADVDIELLKRIDKAEIIAVDASEQMLVEANNKIHENGLTKQIKTKLDRLPGINVNTGEFDIIISKDLLHHLPNPNEFWKEAARIAGDNTRIYLMDLLRPDSVEIAREIVEQNASSEAPILKTDFFNSLLASYTLKEINEQLSDTVFNYTVNLIGDRHFMVKCIKC